MNLTVSKQTFVEKFLDSISKLTNSCILEINKSEITTLTHNNDSGSNVILYGKLNNNSQKSEGKTKLNIPDLKRFAQMLSCIPDDIIALTTDSNSINYESNKMKFKYHLWEDGNMNSVMLSLDKIAKLTFDSDFEITQKKASEILRASSVVPWPSDSNKIYFYTKDNAVNAEITDKTMQNLDSISFEIADSFNGEPVKNIIPINLEIFRLISGLKMDSIKIKINNTLKILLFEIKESDVILKYIVSSLVK